MINAENDEDSEKLERKNVNADDESDSDEMKKQKGVTIVVHRQKEKPELEVSTKAVKVFSIIHVVLGVTVLVTQSIATDFGDYYSLCQEGFVICPLFIITGLLGFLFLYKKTRGMLTATLVLSIILTVFCSVFQIFAGLNLVGEVTRSYRHGRTRIVVYSLHIIIGFIGGLVSLTLACICSRAFCCVGKGSKHPQLMQTPVKIMSILQISIGLFCLICFPLNIYVARTFSIFEEIWCGVIFISTGIFGLIAVRRGGVSLVTAFMVINLFASLTSVVILTTSGVKTGIHTSRRRTIKWELERQKRIMEKYMSYNNCTDVPSPPEDIMSTSEHLEYDNLSDRDPEQEEQERKEYWCRTNYHNFNANVDYSGEATHHEGVTALLAIQILLAVVEIILSIVCSVLCCMSCCGCCGCCGPPMVESTAVFIPQREIEAGAAVVHVSQNEAVAQCRVEDKYTSGSSYARLE